MTLEELNRTSPFHAGAENTAFAPYFDGTSYLHMLSLDQVAVGNVTFAPAAGTTGTSTRPARGRTDPAGHRWPGLLPGMGTAAPRASPRGRGAHSPQRQALARAAPDSPFQHLAIEVPGQDTGSQWLEPVDPDEYNRLK